MNRLLTLIILPVLLLLSVVFAQTTIPSVGQVVVPDYIWTLASVVIGWLVKEISSPLTALLKKRFGFTGSVTQYVYIVLSALFVVGFGLISGAFGSGAAGWWAALGALITAVVRGFGDYTRSVQTAAAGATAVLPAPAVVPPVVGLEDLK